MAVREIVKHTDNFIRKISKPVTAFDEKLWELLDDMWDTLDVTPGAGLSAVQVGVLKRVFVLNINNIKIEFVNPEITASNGEARRLVQQGGLSIDDEKIVDVNMIYKKDKEFIVRKGKKVHLKVELV